MPRPKKDPALKMSTDIRVPVTMDQKRLIQEAVAADKMELAQWVRGIILAAAQERIGKKSVKGKKAGS